MAFSLHSMRTLARRLGVGLAFVFLWSSLAMAIPAPATQQISAQPAQMHAMAHHHTEHAALHGFQQAPQPQPDPQHHHGACCLAGQNCTMACNITLLAESDYGISHAVQVVPLVHTSAPALTRPPQPPRRPPKA